LLEAASLFFSSTPQPPIPSHQGGHGDEGGARARCVAGVPQTQVGRLV
jgi:hypothetical protein